MCECYTLSPCFSLSDSIILIFCRSRYPFIACVHGSGIEPSPKAWEAVLLGCIPIVQHSTLDDAYSQLPVVFVTEWKELFESDNIEGEQC